MTNQPGLSTSILRGSLQRTVSALAMCCALTIIAMPSARAQTFSLLHSFTGARDGSHPMTGLVMDAAGNLYGTTLDGGNTGGACGSQGCGSVFRMTPKNGSWLFTPLYDFQGRDDGSSPRRR